MTKRPSESLPEPGHPFARWCAVAAISCWSLGVQNFSDPWNKLGAILSPGIGYLFGHILDLIIFHLSEATSARKQQKFKKKMDDLCKQRQDYIQFGANPRIISVIDVEIEQCQRIIVEMIGPIAGRKRSGKNPSNEVSRVASDPPV
jgi:hypothetical protein